MGSSNSKNDGKLTGDKTYSGFTINSPNPSLIPNVVPTLDPVLFSHKPECTSVGDCGQLGIYGSNLTCSKKGFCQNCSVDTDCNGVDTPPGKCIDNVCSCLSNSDCSCEGNDPYGCGYDKKGKCTCSREHKGLAALKITPEKTKSMMLILGIGLVLILLWVGYIIKLSKFDEDKAKKYIMYGGGSIFILSVAIAIISGSV